LPTTPPEQQPQAQQPPAQQSPAQQQPSANAWQPGDSRLLADAFFRSLRINGDGTVTVTIPSIPGYEVFAGYMPPRESGEKYSNPEPGKTYTFKIKGQDASIGVSIRKPPNPSNLESYTLYYDKDGVLKVALTKRVNSKLVREEVTLNAVLRGLGLQ